MDEMQHFFPKRHLPPKRFTVDKSGILNLNRGQFLSREVSCLTEMQKLRKIQKQDYSMIRSNLDLSPSNVEEKSKLIKNRPL